MASEEAKAGDPLAVSRICRSTSLVARLLISENSGSATDCAPAVLAACILDELDSLPATTPAGGAPSPDAGAPSQQRRSSVPRPGGGRTPTFTTTSCQVQCHSPSSLHAPRHSHCRSPPSPVAGPLYAPAITGHYHQHTAEILTLSCLPGCLPICAHVYVLCCTHTRHTHTHTRTQVPVPALLHARGNLLPATPCIAA